MLEALYQQLEKSAEAGHVFAEFERESFLYSDLLTMVEKTLAFFASLPLVRGQKIIIMTRNDRALIALLLASWFQGFTSILLLPDTKASKLKRVVGLGEVAALFMDEEEVREQKDFFDLPVIPIAVPKKRALVQKLLKKYSPSQNYPDLLNTFEGVQPNVKVAPEALALVVFTSGSTASPKGVMLTYKNIFSHLKTFKKVFRYSADSVIFNNLPLQHMDGLIQGPLIALFVGACWVRLSPFKLSDLDAQLNEIAARAVTHAVMTPAILALIRRYTEHDDYFARSSFQNLISTAAHLDPQLWEDFQARFKVRISNVYGLIETVTGGIFCGPDPDSFQMSTVGKPVDIEVKIVDELGRALPPGQIGELLLRGENVAVGYLGNPEASSEVFREGWFYTGDLAVQSVDGFVELKGRKKEIIITRGFVIYPEEINETLRLHPSVLDVATVGMPDELLGEMPVSVLEVSGVISAPELFCFLQKELEHKKMPQEIFLIDKIPRGPTGKPLLRDLTDFIQTKRQRSGASGPGVDPQNLLQLAGEVFKVSAGELSMYSSPSNVLAWDSLGHIRLVEAMERHFKVNFSMKDIVQMTSLRDFYDRIEDLVS